MAYCNNCGTNNPDEATICTNCGATISSDISCSDTPSTTASSSAQQGGTLALLALIFGILGFVIGWPSSIAAIILGAIAINQGDRSDKAKAGLILGIIATALPIVMAIVGAIALVLFYIVYFAIIIIVNIIALIIALIAMAASSGMGF